MTMLQMLSGVVGFYLVIEAVSASAEMNEGDSFFCIVKYLFVGYVGSSLIMYTYTWDKLIYASTIALFLLPKLGHRIKFLNSQFKRRASDK